MRANFFLVLVLILAFFFRFYRFDLVPPSLYWDEVAIGYNAWSVLTTGADEYGHKLPLLFESFQDFKLPGFVYSIVPFIKIWGLSKIAVRLPSIIFGVLSVLFLFLLVSQLFNKKVAILSSLLLATTPWAIQFSRAGFEVNAGVTITILSLYFLVKSLTRQKWLTMGIILSAISLYFYYTNRILIPLFFLCFVPFFWRNLRQSKTELAVSLFLGTLLCLPLYFLTPSYSRFSYVSIFNDPNIISQAAEFRKFDNNSLLARFFHNRYLVYGKELFKNYLLHYSSMFLFFGADGNPRHGIAGVGLLHLWQLPFLVFGIYKLLARKDKALKVLILWALFAPVASSVAEPSPHALRALLLMPPLLVFTAYGLSVFIENINYSIKVVTSITLTIVAFYAMIYYFHQLFVHYPRQSSRDWAYGYKEVFMFVKNRRTDYNNIFITGKYWRPYIFALFYLQYPADKYQRKPLHNRIDNIYFGHADYDTSDPYYDYQSMQKMEDKIRNSSKSLLVISPTERVAEDNVIRTIIDLQGEPLFLIVTTRS